jgi:hypothetical protein
MERVNILLDLLKDADTDCFRFVINTAWPNRLQLYDLSEKDFEILVEKIKKLIEDNCDNHNHP